MLDDLKSKLAKALEVFQTEIKKVRTGRAHPDLVEGVMVESYGAQVPLKQVANVGAPDAQTIAIQPWDRANLAPIEKGIIASGLGLNPLNDGQMIRITIPPLSAERRTELVKVASARAEEAKVAIRNLRRDAMEDIKKQINSEDEQKRLEKQVQDMVDDFVSRVEIALGDKEKEITTI
ncbi:MAG: ribosome recycling factor [Patescibacteria group bacterium]|nr:ribosome recycling factor [Patescibacteria group bacterium]